MLIKIELSWQLSTIYFAMIVRIVRVTELMTIALFYIIFYADHSPVFLSVGLIRFDDSLSNSFSEWCILWLCISHLLNLHSNQNLLFFFFLVKPVNKSIDHCHFCWSHAFISFVLEHLTAHLIDVIFIWSKTTHTHIHITSTLYIQNAVHQLANKHVNAMYLCL